MHIHTHTTNTYTQTHAHTHASGGKHKRHWSALPRNAKDDRNKKNRNRNRNRNRDCKRQLTINMFTELTCEGDQGLEGGQDDASGPPRRRSRSPEAPLRRPYIRYGLNPLRVFRKTIFLPNVTNVVMGWCRWRLLYYCSRRRSGVCICTFEWWNHISGRSNCKLQGTCNHRQRQLHGWICLCLTAGWPGMY